MEIKPYWVLVAGFIILLIFVLVVVISSRPHWINPNYRPGHYVPESSNWFGPGGIQHLLGPGGTRHLFGATEGFAGDSSPTFTMFGVDWCGHCQTAKPIFKSMGPTVTIGGKVVNLRYVNPEEDKDAAKGYDIQGFPTFYLDNNGKSTKYSGGRDVSSFQEFLQQHLTL